MAFEDPEMRGRESTNVYETPGDREKTVSAIVGGSVAEALVGAGAVVLAAIGLANMYPESMAAIAIIALGVSLLLQGTAIASRSVHLAELAGVRETATGFSGETIGGIIGIVLGILVLLGVSPAVLIPVAVVVLGSTTLFGGATLSRFRVVAPLSMGERARVASRKFVDTAFGIEVVVGIAAIIMAILAMLDVYPRTLIFLSLIALGVAVLLGGSAVAGRLKGSTKGVYSSR